MVSEHPTCNPSKMVYDKNLNCIVIIYRYVLPKLIEEKDCTPLLEKFPAFFFFNWTFIRMHEFFPCLLIASVDGKQHLS